jgi:uncharacterized protein YbjT (DUF2867 family)
MNSSSFAAGVGHHVALSVVGTERLLESGFFRAKLAQENLIKASSIPCSIRPRDAVLRVRKADRRFFQLCARLAIADRSLHRNRDIMKRRKRTVTGNCPQHIHAGHLEGHLRR